MKDQVEQLIKRNIPAAAIFSGMGYREIDIILDNCIYGKFKFLYVSPERLKTEIFLERAKKMKVDLIAVDEAHCISQWGYDFRPPYLEIASFRELFPKVPIIALTATATKEVKEDIQHKLLFNKARLFQKSFARDNLSYSVFFLENKEKKLLEILRKIRGSGIVYVKTRRRTREISDFLLAQGLSSSYYHAGLDHKQRAIRQESWINNQTRIIVATNAFGMGIDKPDVRVVVHLDLTNSLEAYYQEAGRAGRDEKKAYAVMLFHEGDVDDLRGWLSQAYPSFEFIKQVYQSLANFYKIAIGSNLLASFDFILEDFTKAYKLQPMETYHALKKLQDEGFIYLNESFFNPSRAMFLVDHQELYKYQVAHASLDPFIKAVLRIYGGELFTGFINISLPQISKFMNVAVDEVEKALKTLHQQNVIIYDPQKDKPQLTFLTPRFAASQLPIDKEKLEERKKIDTIKTEAVINYVKHNERCRTLLLLEYFNEISFKNCGICDVCVKRKKREDGENLNSEWKTIRSELASGPLSLEKLVEKLKPKDEEKFIKVIRQLIDSQLIVYDETGRLKNYNYSTEPPDNPS
ncbi:RecQ family ATP-dependent DNA helicase [soil metagenome]